MKTVTLCSVCINKFSACYTVTEKRRREKVTCENCRKRRYGALCDVEKKNK